MNPPRKPTIGTSGPPGHANLEEDQLERELDEALLETFPASDPIAITSEDERDEPDDKVDEALEDTFPASDPPAPAQPGKNRAATSGRRRAVRRRHGSRAFSWKTGLEMGHSPPSLALEANLYSGGLP